MKNEKKEIVIWGSGKIGRGFIADIFNKGGYSITFIDANKQLVSILKERGKYTVINMLSTDEKEEIVISNYEVYHTDEKMKLIKKLLNCSLIAMAVLPTAFVETASEISEIIEARALNENLQMLDIIICTNTFQPGNKFKKLLVENLSDKGRKYLAENVGIIETVVIRLAIEPTQEMKVKDPLVVLTNGYSNMLTDINEFKGDLPECKMILYTDNIYAENIRKMYTYNMLHAVFAYVGSQKNYKYVIECTQDKELREIAVNTLEEVSLGLQREFGYSKEEMCIWNKRVMQDMSNPFINVELKRMGADPIRKLKKDDRLVGPALLCRKNGILPYYLSKAIAGGFTFLNLNDQSCVSIKEYLAENDIKTAIKHFCQLDKEVELIQLIVEQYNKIISGDEIKEDTTRISVIKNAYEKGFHYELKYRGCAQSILAALFDVTGNMNSMLFQAASGLSGGTGLCGDGSCGGYIGGVMLMSSYIGRSLENIPINGDKIAQYKSYEMAQRLHDKYIATYGSVTCSEIHKKVFGKAYCLKTKEVREKFELAGAHKTICTTIIAMAAAWTAEILMDEKFID